MGHRPWLLQKVFFLIISLRSNKGSLLQVSAPVHLVDRAVWEIAIDVLQKAARHEVERDGILIAVHVAPGAILVEVDDGAIVEDAHICVGGGLNRNDRVALEVVLDEGLGLGWKLQKAC